MFIEINIKETIIIIMAEEDLFMIWGIGTCIFRIACCVQPQVAQPAKVGAVREPSRCTLDLISLAGRGGSRSPPTFTEKSQKNWLSEKLCARKSVSGLVGWWGGGLASYYFSISR